MNDIAACSVKRLPHGRLPMDTGRVVGVTGILPHTSAETLGAGIRRIPLVYQRFKAVRVTGILTVPMGESETAP